MKARCIGGLIVAVLVLASCGDDVSTSSSDDPLSDPTTSEEESSEPDTDGETSQEVDAPDNGALGTGTITVGANTWEIQGTCNSPQDGIILLTGTAADDSSVEIYVTATPAIPDSASARVTKAGEFDWFADKNIEAIETTYDAGVAQGSATFVDLDQPPLDAVHEEGSWEFRC